MRPLLEVIEVVRGAVDPRFAVTVKLNATDRQAGGFTEAESLAVIGALDATGIDLIDISGGTYFPGATLGEDREGEDAADLRKAIGAYDERDRKRVSAWSERFGPCASS